LPKFSGDVLPQTPIGICLALADRLDTLVGILLLTKHRRAQKTHSAYVVQRLVFCVF